MFKALFVYVKYPSVAGIISVIWLGSGILILFDRQLPILHIVVLNSVISAFMGTIGFRVDRKS